MSVKRVSKTRQVFEATKRQMERAVDAGQKAAVAEMVRLVPVLSGFLRDSITGKTLSPVSASIIVLAFYGIYIEYGTFRSSAQAFFRPGLDVGRKVMKENLKVVAD